MAVISSRANAQVKAIRALRNRRERDRTGLFFAESERIVREAVRAGAEIATIVLAPERLTAADRMLVGQIQGASVLEVSADVFDSISFREDPQAIGIVARQRWQRFPASTSASTFAGYR